MTSEVMLKKLSRMGGRVSGLEKGLAVRGTNSRGAKDVAALGDVTFESIASDGRYHRFEISAYFEYTAFDPALVTDALATPGLVRYWGVLPCADCAGIRTELQLVQDPKTGEPQTYELTETHLADNTEGKPNTTRGKWTIRRGVRPAFVEELGGRAEPRRTVRGARRGSGERHEERSVTRSKPAHAVQRVPWTSTSAERPRGEAERDPNRAGRSGCRGGAAS